MVLNENPYGYKPYPLKESAKDFIASLLALMLFASPALAFGGIIVLYMFFGS